MTEQLPAVVAEPELDAYALLSKPTLDLSDAEVARICADLRVRRARYIATNKPDKAPAKPKEPLAKLSPTDKLRNTQALLESLGGLKLPGLS
jgi:chromatin segregation and condensation protein Rec8/ScpA/Scc1 (kleisin family)